MSNIFSRPLSALLIACVLLTAPIHATDPPPKKPRLRITISKETTYITEPLRPDGYPDYVAALNEISSRGVTPENNSAVLFWKAVGPSAIPKELRNQYFQMLGIPPLPENGDYFITSDEWIKRVTSNAEKPSKATLTVDFDYPIWSKQRTQAMHRPWSKDEFPILADWLAANEKTLAILIEASKCPKYYSPIIHSENGTKNETQDFTCACNLIYRDIAEAFVIRATLLLKTGKTKNAWENLLACHRLARLVAQGPTIIDVLVGAGIEKIANAGDQALLQYATLTGPEISGMRNDLRNLAPMPAMADKIIIGERFLGLDTISLIARNGSGSLWKLLGHRIHPNLVESVVCSVILATVDWDALLCKTNSWYDQFFDVIHEVDRHKQDIARNKAEKYLKGLWETSDVPVAFCLAAVANPCSAISEWFSNRFLLMLALPVTVTIKNEWYHTIRFDLNNLAFALAQYRADHGSYPAKLADLTPKYIADIPKDIFNDSNLHYQTTAAGYLLYSVGLNGKDDGGKGFDDAKDGEPWSDDLTIRMEPPK